MRKLSVAILLIAVCAFAAWPAREVTLAWDYPAADESPDMVFNVRATTNLSTPMPWPLLTNTPGTNRVIKLMLVPNRYCFYLTASNWWGESDPSNTVDTPRNVGNSTNLSIKR